MRAKYRDLQNQVGKTPKGLLIKEIVQYLCSPFLTGMPMLGIRIRK
jgi:hypothetical protein